MSRILLRSFGVLVLSVAVCALLSCGGASSAPINGSNSLSGVSVAVSPASMTVTTGTTQAFTATVYNSNVSGVQWLVNGFPGGGGNIGTIDSNGNYTAPQYVPIPAQVTVSAVSVADNTKSGTATVSITGTPIPAQISISPTAAALNAGTTLNLTATVTGPADTAVIWQVVDNGIGVVNGNGTVGTIVPGPNGATAVYTAPATIPSGGSVTIKALSHSQPNVSASCVVTIVDIQSVTLSTTTATVQAETSFVFKATVVGSGDISVVWEVNGIPGGNATVGTVTPSGANNSTGTYTAPSTVPTGSALAHAATTSDTVTVTAVSAALPSKFASATVTITPAPANAVTVVISPSSATVLENGTINFTAAVSKTTNTTVTWQVNGVPGGNATFGTITSTGSGSATYVAPPAVPAQNPVIVSAIPNAAPNVSGTASVTITGPATVTISPTSASVEASTIFTFTATVQGAGITNPNAGVTWYVNNAKVGNPVVGTIAGSSPTNNVSTAVYSAPPKQPPPPGNVVTITAVSDIQQNVVSNPATVTITPPPANAVTVQVIGATELDLCTQTEYTAAVGNTTNPSIMAWQVNGVTGGNSTYGTITPVAGNSNMATYVPPQQLPTPAVVVIGAIPAAAPNEAGTLDVTLTSPAIQVNVVDTQNNSSAAQVGVGQTAPLQATVTNSCTVQTASWYVGQNGNYVEGGNSTLGTIAPESHANVVTYTAPASVPSNPVVTVEAKADALPSAVGTATITINSAPIIILSITPSTPQTVDFQGSTGNADVEYFATITGTTSNDVTWEVNGYVGGDDTCVNSQGNPCGIGTIGPDPANPGNPLQALYTAPVAVPSPPTVNVTAVFAGPPQVVSNSDPVTIVTPPPPPPTITITPGTVFPIIPGQTLMPTASITCPGGGCNQVVDWSLSLASGVACTVATCGSLNPLQTDGAATTYTSPTSIPTDPYYVNLTATDDSDQSVQATAQIEITASATTSISISPTNPTVQAASGGTITFTATVINAPAGDSNVTWEMGCNSLAPFVGTFADNCGFYSSPPGFSGPGCISDSQGNKQCTAAAGLVDPPSVNITYTPPQVLGSSFTTNACTSTQGTNGIVPLTATVGGNCNADSCTAQTCITVTPP